MALRKEMVYIPLYFLPLLHTQPVLLLLCPGFFFPSLLWILQHKCMSPGSHVYSHDPPLFGGGDTFSACFLWQFFFPISFLLRMPPHWLRNIGIGQSGDTLIGTLALMVSVPGWTRGELGEFPDGVFQSVSFVVKPMDP